MINRNFQKEMDSLISKLKAEDKVPTLMLHSCCAPCSSYVLEYLSEYFRIMVVYYNPNISKIEEYDLRLAEQKRLIEQMPFKNPVTLIAGEYNPLEFFEIAKGLEDCRERGKRCHRCYRLRLEYTAKLAKEKGTDYFATTLTLSPLKDAKVINEIGEELSKKYDTPYLASDFKKKEGYKRSLELSKEYNLYRQSFCGCIYSQREKNKKEDL
ncbi:MAG: epoxyqueuosine reductase QueH [Ruminococcaceae bacterium]|nr:epoxyqueuosine reductase QueH [Oscillospiraceae bacterium]